MSWLGFNTAVTGLMGSQKKIYTANHNIANAEREGYSRQVTKEEARRALRLPGKGFIGTGSDITSIVRKRDSYIDFKFRKENSPRGEWDVKETALKELEDILKGSRDHGINVSLDEFFSSLQDLSVNPSDDSYRIAFRQKLVALTGRLNETASAFNGKQAMLNKEVGSKIKESNELAKQIGRVNEQIFRMEIDGNPANDLRDERDLLIDKLSKIVDIDVEEGDSVTIKVGGRTMVDHGHTMLFEYPPKTETSTIDPRQELYQLKWSDGESVSLESGELKGLMDTRDGGNGDNENFKGVPYYVERLNEFARNFAKKMNDIHETGGDPDTNIKLFTIDNKESSSLTDYTEIDALNISVSKDIMDSLDNIMTSKDTNYPEDNKLVLELIDQRENNEFFVKNTIHPDEKKRIAYSGRPEDFMTAIMSTLGTDSQYSERMYKNQDAISENISMQRMSVSGVDLNEEMNGVVRFQQLYNASARMITTFDEIFDMTINRLGIVGR